MFDLKKTILAIVFTAFIACNTVNVNAVNWREIKTMISKNKGKIIVITAATALTLTYPTAILEFTSDETLLALKNKISDLCKDLIFSEPVIIFIAKTIVPPIYRTTRDIFWHALIRRLHEHGLVIADPNLAAFEGNTPMPPHIRISDETHILQTDDIPENFDDTCLICRDIMIIGSATDPIVQIDACRHNFHILCLIRWGEQHNTCPACRQLTNRPATIQQVR